jgi:hypothetical protein
MNDTEKDKDALQFLLSSAKSSEEEIESMTSAQLEGFLAERGVDVNALRAKIPIWQQRAAGKIAMARARRSRLGSCEVAARREDVASKPAKIDQLLAMLVGHFGSLEAIPMAARNLKAVNAEELQQLIDDLGLGSRNKAAPDETTQPDQG